MRIDCVSGALTIPCPYESYEAFFEPKGSMNRFAERRPMRDHSHASTPSHALCDCSVAVT